MLVLSYMQSLIPTANLLRSNILDEFDLLEIFEQSCHDEIGVQQHIV
jgi:hypothetical protein